MTLAQLGRWVRGLVGAVPVAELIREAAPVIAKMFEADVFNNFTESRTPQLVPWRPVRRPGLPLIDTGRLMRAALAACLNPVVTARSLTFDLDHPDYALTHEVGRPPVHARPYFGMRQETLDKVAKALGAALVQRVINNAKV